MKPAYVRITLRGWMLRLKTRNLADPPRKATIQPAEFSSGQDRTRPISPPVEKKGGRGLAVTKVYLIIFLTCFCSFF